MIHMKIYIEGSVEEIDEFLYGGDCEDCDEECAACEQTDRPLTPDEKLKLNLLNAFANTVDIILAKHQG